MIVLIPAYEPGESLSRLVRELVRADPHAGVVVVDDGSGAAYAAEFDAARRAGASVVSYPVNRGKGYALRVGLEYIGRLWPHESVVCADSDGQHRVDDILRVALRTEELGDSLVLGGRRFVGDVPLRSRFGNSVSRLAFRAVGGVRVHDTQTGLRGYPPQLIAWALGIAGDRFEYELNLLLDAAATGIPIVEVEVATVYLHENASSHFRPIVDSMRVVRPLLAFGASSLGAFALDLAALQVIFALSGSLLLAVVGARLISGSVNFLVNRHLVFRSRSEPLGVHAIRYVALALGVVTAGYVLISALTALGMPLVPAKIVVDAGLYVLSFQVQRLAIFARSVLRPGRHETELVLDPRRR